MAQTYPYTTPEKSMYVAGVPFSDTSGAGQINGSQWDHCKITINGVTNNVLSGKLYFEVTTRRDGYAMTDYSIGTSYGPYYSPYWTSVAYSLRFNCYNTNNQYIGAVTPIDQRTIYQNTGTKYSNGKMYNWTNSNHSNRTCEPWVIRYASDIAGDLYNMQNTYYDTTARYRYNNRNNVSRRYFSNDGWLDFSVTLPAATSYFGVDLLVYNKPNSSSSNPPAYQLQRTLTLYSASVDPVIVDGSSKIIKKPAGSSSWQGGARIWYKKANSTTWEKKFAYKKSANSASWTKV